MLSTSAPLLQGKLSMRKEAGPNPYIPPPQRVAAGRDRGTIKSQLAQAGKAINPITLKRFSWEKEDESE